MRNSNRRKWLHIIYYDSLLWGKWMNEIKKQAYYCYPGFVIICFNGQFNYSADGKKIDVYQFYRIKKRVY